MTDTTRLDSRPEVTGFVAAVRARLGDLSEEEREELVGGLEADLAELVADGGSVAELGDPRAYADELRAAAGLDRAGEPARRRPTRAALAEVLDSAHARVEQLAGTRAPGAWSFLQTLRPVWWVLRAWVAVHVLALVLGTSSHRDLVPSFRGLGWVVMLLAVVASVQIGRERWWPGTALRRSVGLRLLLLGLNAFAVLVLPVVLDSVGPGYTEGYDAGYADVAPVRPGLMDRGAWVRNVFAYDAQGRPLTGVQLFDQDGRPLAVSTGVEEWSDSGRAEVVYPWLSGSDGRPVFNVFPLPVRSQGSYDDSAHPQAWSSTRPPRLPAAPLVAVPPAALPSSGPSGAASPSAQPSAQASAQPSAKPSPRP